MNTHSARWFWLFVIAASAVSGCALLQKGEPGAARYFSPERGPLGPVVPAAIRPGARPNRPELRLGRITGAPHLEERLVHRDSSDEIGYYRELRWTEPPELAMERLLARALFEERGLGHVVGGPGPTLDVQLTAFDEIRKPEHLARARVVATLHDDHRVLWEETLTVDRAVSDANRGDAASATVDALCEALLATAQRIADAVVRELEEAR